jgi:hypothetical protein
MPAKQFCILVLASVVVAVVASPAFTQDRRSDQRLWKIWSPPDRSFSVEVPEPLETNDELGEESDPDAVQSFGVDTKDFVLIAIILRYEDFATKTTEDKFGGLFFVLGGDDDFDFTEKNVNIRGMPAQEIVYNKRPIKGLFIDASDTVYVLGLRAKKKEDVNAAVANRFFSSFSLNPNVNVKRIFLPKPSATPSRGDPPVLQKRSE